MSGTGRRTGKPLFKVSLRIGTALSTAVAAALFISHGPAKADNDCGAPMGGIVTCKPAGNPYDGGILYLTKKDLDLTVEDGVVVNGRVRVDGEGDTNVTIDVAAGAAINATGFFRTGVEANTVDGDVRIDARGSITTKGFDARGIRASTNGAVSIGSGDIASEGGDGIYVAGGGKLVSIEAAGTIHSVEGVDLFGPGLNPANGIIVYSDGNVRILNSGLIDVDSSSQPISGTDITLPADGIHVETVGDVILNGGGAITTSQKGSLGVFIRSDAIHVEQESVTTEGEDATAILAAGISDVSVAVGSVSSARSRGVVAQSREGDVSVDYGSVSAVGNGIDVLSPKGSVRVSGGEVTVTGPAAGMIVLAGKDAAINVNDRISAVQGYGVVIDSGGKANLDIAALGSIEAGFDAVRIVTDKDAGASIKNEGTITGGSGFALLIEGGPATIENAGTISGRIQLTGADDLLTNSGMFDATADSNFGMGSDRFVNSGTINVFSQGGNQGGVVLFGLERFENSGAINLADGRADGYLQLAGDYLGSGGLLQVDVRLARGTPAGADQLILNGAATGRTLVVPSGLDGPKGLLNRGAAIVFAGPGSSPDAFTTDGLNAGFVEYGVVFDALDNIYSLVGAPGDAAYRTPKYIEGAQNLWYLSSDAWSAHLRGSRDGRRKDAAGRLWSQAYGSIDTRRSVSETTFAGVTVSSGSSYNQDYFGGQAGYDFMQLGGPGSMFIAGVTGGYISSNLDFRGSPSEANYDAVNAGLSGSFSSGILFANILGKYDHYWLDAEDRSIGLNEKIGGDAYGVTAEIGLRAGSDRLFFEPVAALSYVRTTLDGFSALSSEIDFDAADGLRGKLGARAGSSFDTLDGTHVSFYIGGNAVKEFEGKDGVTFRNNGQEIAIANDRIGLYGEGIAGLDVSNGRFSGFLEGFGKFGSSDDVRGGGGRAGISVDF